MVVRDSEERAFDNFTSLDWTLSSSNQNALPRPHMDSLEYKNKHGERGVVSNVTICILYGGRGQSCDHT